MFASSNPLLISPVPVSDANAPLLAAGGGGAGAGAGAAAGAGAEAVVGAGAVPPYVVPPMPASAGAGFGGSAFAAMDGRVEIGGGDDCFDDDVQQPATSTTNKALRMLRHATLAAGDQERSG